MVPRAAALPAIVPWILAAVVGVAGCSRSDGVHRSGAEYPTWPAIDRFRSDDLMPISMTADFGDWEKFRSLVGADTYRAAVEEFAATPVPGKWATPARTAAKDKAVADMKALIEAAKLKKPAKELESLWRTAGQSLGEVTKPVGP